jgi:hypothetical protein
VSAQVMMTSWFISDFLTGWFKYSEDVVALSAAIKAAAGSVIRVG